VRKRFRTRWEDGAVVRMSGRASLWMAHARSWKPDLKVVRASIRFLYHTGRPSRPSDMNNNSCLNININCVPIIISDGCRRSFEVLANLSGYECKAMFILVLDSN
jgi:hypothetical protein